MTEHHIESLADIMRLEPDQIRRCLQELCEALPVLKANEHRFFGQLVIVWTDDGIREAEFTQEIGGQVIGTIHIKEGLLQ